MATNPALFTASEGEYGQLLLLFFDFCHHDIVSQTRGAEDENRCHSPVAVLPVRYALYVLYVLYGETVTNRTKLERF